MENALISIIMAVYNCEDTVRKSIDSILAQTYTNWEFIICDDCSTDHTTDIIKEYKNQYPEKFTILRNKKNSKLSYSLNHCLKYAKGIYIARMDGDDVSLPTRLSEQVGFLRNNKKFQLVGTDMKIFNGQTIIGERQYKPVADKFDMVKNPCFAHATIMTYKYVYESLGGYTVSKRTERGQDYDLWFRFFQKGYQGANLGKALYVVTEDASCYKRKKLKYRFHAMQTMLIGFKRVHMPWKYYIYAFRPLLVGLVPVSLMKRIKEIKLDT